MPTAKCNPGPCQPKGPVTVKVNGAWTSNFQTCAQCGNPVFLARTQTKDQR